MRSIPVLVVGLLSLALPGCTSFGPVPILDFEALAGAARAERREPPPAPQPARRPPPAYVVERGDTLSRIAEQHGTSVGALVRANALSDPDQLEVGRQLALPAGVGPRPARPARVRVAAAPAPAPAKPAPIATTDPTTPLFAVDCALHDGDERLRSAHFEEAIERADEARSLLREVPAQPSTAKRRARLELLSGMAEVALGRDAVARASFERALRADPELRLAPAEVSPKILRLFEETRAQIAERQARR